VLQVLAYALLPGVFLALTIPQMLYFLGMGFTLPQTMAASLTPFPERAGAASSLMGFIQMTSASGVGAIMGASFGATAWPLVTVMALAGVCVFSVFHLTASARPAGTRRFH
jgi:DHA1 family bicyclomycin/chloramphenicol resistance-like MFS transporter